MLDATKEQQVKEQQVISIVRARTLNRPFNRQMTRTNGLLPRWRLWQQLPLLTKKRVGGEDDEDDDEVEYVVDNATFSQVMDRESSSDPIIPSDDDDQQQQIRIIH
jgi:hypothetical protein